MNILYEGHSQEYVFAPRVHGIRDARGGDVFIGGQGEDGGVSSPHGSEPIHTGSPRVYPTTS